MMRKPIATAVAALLLAGPAWAEDGQVASNETGETERLWTVSASAGSTLSGGGIDDQGFASLSLSRSFGDSYLQLSADFIDSSDSPGAFNLVPARTSQLTLAGGTGIGPIAVDLYLSKGWRSFNAGAFSVRGQNLSAEGNGESFGAGASLTYDMLVGERDFLLPYIALDYSALDVGRAVALPNGEFLTVEETEKGVAGTLGLSWQHLIGANYQHNAGLSIAGVTSSNTGAFALRNGPRLLTQLIGLRNTPGQNDSWIELGGSASFSLSDSTRLHLSAARTLGFTGPESTSLSAGLTLSF